MRYHFGCLLWVLMLLFQATKVSLLRNDGIKYDSVPNLVELTPANFRSNVLDSDDVWIVQFYAPWCRYCKKLAPEWIKTAQSLKGQIKMGNVNAPLHPTLQFQYSVWGFPSILIFADDKTQPKVYYGPRTAPDMIEYFSNFTDSRIERK